jgi:hypothetical protein
MRLKDRKGKRKWREKVGVVDDGGRCIRVIRFFFCTSKKLTPVTKSANF